MTTTTIVPLRDHAAFLETAAQWFSQKWDIPAQAIRKVYSNASKTLRRFPNGIWY